MNIAALPPNEADRLEALRRYNILDTEAEQAFDDLTTLAAQICQAPIALISLVDENRQWFKSKCGLDAGETSRDLAFCAHAILQPDDLLIVPNTLEDERFADNPLVTHGPCIRFYAGAPLISPSNHALGTICVIDRQPRILDSKQKNALRALARQVVSQLELRLNLSERENIIQQLQQKEAVVRQSESQLKGKNKELEATLLRLHQTQSQLVQSEKMSGLGQLVAGVAHEINNPVSFIAGNVNHANDYIHGLLDLVALYQQQYPEPGEAIQDKLDAIDLSFIQEDAPKLLNSMQIGSQRIQQIVRSLRTFSHKDEAEMKVVDLHNGIDSSLMLLSHRLKAQPQRVEIQAIQNYDAALPAVECYPGQLNQVFMNLLSNSIDAVEEKLKTLSSASEEHSTFQPTIWIETQYDASTQQGIIRVRDNGCGISESTQEKIFDPFFTTKSVGKGTGMGLSISYQIATEKHAGTLKCDSTFGRGSTFTLRLPLQQKNGVSEEALSPSPSRETLLV